MSRRSAGDLYIVLGLKADASEAEIRAAYRRMAWRLHPDRNAEDSAQAEFQKVNEAYATLGNPDLRAAYDRARAAGVREEPSGAAGPQPICCTECGRATAQPRILVFQTVMSFALWSKRNFIEGIFCVACARRTALEASMVCATRGWWAPPGPILTMIAIGANALGGGRSPLSDHKLLFLNAQAFAASNQTSLAYALARKVSQSARPPLAVEARQMMTALRSRGVPERTPRLVDPWRPSLPHLAAHVLLMLTGPAVAVIAVVMLGWIGGMFAPPD